MAFNLTELPYADLAPAVSAETLSFHYGKHHQAYIDKMNAAIEGTAHADAALEAIVAAARGSIRACSTTQLKPGTTVSIGFR